MKLPILVLGLLMALVAPATAIAAESHPPSNAESTTAGRSAVPGKSVVATAVRPHGPAGGGGVNLVPINCAVFPETFASWVNHWMFIGGQTIWLNAGTHVQVAMSCDTSMAMGVAFQTFTPQGQVALALSNGLAGKSCGAVVNACVDSRNSLTTIQGKWVTGFINVFQLTQAQQSAGYRWSSWDPNCAVILNGSGLSCTVIHEWTLPNG